ncbi:MAG: hypothetical protein AAF990_20000 [Bacteroidota bacterium]
MAKKEDIQKRVERYLEEELDSEERRQFEKDIQSDEALARELVLHQDMEELLADSPENELRKSLQQLSGQVEVEPAQASSGSVRYLYWLLLPLLLLLVWWFVGRPAADPDISSPPPASDTPVQQEGTQEDVPESTAPMEEPTESAPPPDDAASPPQKKEAPPKSRPSKKERPIAANFDPIPELEFLIDNPLRSNVRIEASHLQENIRKSRSKDSVDFHFSGTLTSPSSVSGCKLHIFSNDQIAFEAFEGVVKQPLKLTTTSKDTYAFNIRMAIPLDPGLYYYLIEDAKENTLFVQKFTVR